MAQFIMVRYNNKKYPQHIPCEISEEPGHFAKKRLSQKSRYSLHTEYSYEKRKEGFDSDLLDGLDEIKSANKGGIAQLWKNQQWAKEFFAFICNLLRDSIDPEIIEIHPPFVDYCNSVGDFLDIYKTFEKSVLQKYVNTQIFLENRCGTRYGAKFLISNCNDVINLCEALSERKFHLKLVLDYPQLMSSER